MIRHRSLAAGLFLAASIGAASAAQAVTVDAYQKWRLSGKTFRATPTSLITIHVGGVLQGFIQANSRLSAAGGPVLFCMPEGAPPEGMTSGDLRKLVDAELKSTTRPNAAPWPPKTPIAAVILRVLRLNWPCRAGRRQVR